MDVRQLLSNLSGKFFLVAMLIGKGSFLKPPLVGHVFFLLSTILYLFGYIAWKAALFIDPTTASPKELDELNLRLLFNNEYRAAALIGIIACLIGMFSLINPLCGLISAWLYLASNACWCGAEWRVHSQFNLTHPTQAQSYKHSNYFWYVQIATAGSLLAALHLTLSLAILPFALSPIGQAIFVAVIILNIVGFYKLGCATFGWWGPKETKRTPINQNENSHQSFTLGPCANQLTEKIPTKQAHVFSSSRTNYPGFWQPQEKVIPAAEDTKIPSPKT